MQTRLRQQAIAHSLLLLEQFVLHADSAVDISLTCISSPALTTRPYNLLCTLQLTSGVLLTIVRF